MNTKQALTLAIKALQEKQRQYTGMAIYYRDFDGPYKSTYEKWQKINEAIELLKSIKEHS